LRRDERRIDVPHLRNGVDRHALEVRQGHDDLPSRAGDTENGESLRDARWWRRSPRRIAGRRELSILRFVQRTRGWARAYSEISWAPWGDNVSWKPSSAISAY
jgi:hypothetical protein